MPNIVFKIILFFARNVNRTDDVSVTAVDIEKLRDWSLSSNRGETIIQFFCLIVQAITL